MWGKYLHGRPRMLTRDLFAVTNLLVLIFTLWGTRHGYFRLPADLTENLAEKLAGRGDTRSLFSAVGRGKFCRWQHIGLARQVKKDFEAKVTEFCTRGDFEIHCGDMAVILLHNQKQAVGGRPPRYAPAQACKCWHDILYVRIWIGHHYCMSMLACQYNQPKQPSDLDLWPFDLESGVRVSVTWATSVPILVFLSLSVLELRPVYATDRRQT